MKTHNNLEESLGYFIGRARRAMANRINQQLEKAGHDVTCEQGSILMNLRQKNRQSQKELVKCICKDKTSITRLIDGLEKRSLVVRVSGKKDGREKLICLTTKGEELQRKFQLILTRTIEEAQRGINKKDLEICKNVLSQVGQNLG